MNDDANRHARLILRHSMQLCSHIIDLDQPHGQKGNDFNINAAANRPGEGRIRAEALKSAAQKRVLRLLSRAKQNVCERETLAGSETWGPNKNVWTRVPAASRAP